MSKMNFFILPFLIIIYSCSDTNPVDNSDPTYTDIKGYITEDLNLADSPFRVLDTIFLDSLSTVSIEAGVKLYFTDSSMFIVKGTLSANGQRAKPIFFSSLVEKWKGIKITNSQINSIFQYAIFENVIVDENNISDFGAIEVDSSVVTFRNCIFRNNFSIQGGGLSLINSSVNIHNNIFINNQATAFGGAILSYNSETKIINNTFYKNFSHNHGGGLVLYNSKNDSIQNNIFYENTGNSGDSRISIVSSDSSNYYIDYNLLSVNSPDPGFRSETDLRLSEGSFCIDKGNPLKKYNDTDGSRNDQGAYGGPWGDWYYYIIE